MVIRTEVITAAVATVVVVILPVVEVILPVEVI